MRRDSWIRAVIASGILVFGGVARAGVPFINFEGVGGVALNPLAYSASDGEEGMKAGFLEIAKPRIGTWYFHLGESAITPGIDWTTLGIATSFNKRLEVSVGYEAIAIQNVSNVQKWNVAGKLVLLDENAFGTSFLPALSLGVIWKTTDYHPNADGSGVDVYAVATKMVGPVLLSVGGLSTQGEVMGTIGFNSQRAIIAFANVDVVPVSWLAIGAEYRMGPNYGASGGGYVDGDYFDIHAGWFVTKGFTLAAAYAYAASKTNGAEPISTANPIGFGPGFTLTGQYAF